MGSKISPILANIVMKDLETEVRNNIFKKSKFSIHVYYRFVEATPRGHNYACQATSTFSSSTVMYYCLKFVCFLINHQRFLKLLRTNLCGNIGEKRSSI